MKILIIYDSVFGNTKLAALAMGSALGISEEAGVFQVGSVKMEQLSGLDLLLVGSPTRGFRPTEAVTKFLKAIPQGALKGVRAAAFDTRIAPGDIGSPILRLLVRAGGYAAKPIVGLLVKKGAQIIAPPEGFCVEKSEGPLKQGELERAAEWAKGLV